MEFAHYDFRINCVHLFDPCKINRGGSSFCDTNFHVFHSFYPFLSTDLVLLYASLSENIKFLGFAIFAVAFLLFLFALCFVFKKIYPRQAVLNLLAAGPSWLGRQDEPLHYNCVPLFVTLHFFLTNALGAIESVKLFYR